MAWPSLVGEAYMSIAFTDLASQSERDRWNGYRCLKLYTYDELSKPGKQSSSYSSLATTYPGWVTGQLVSDFAITLLSLNFRQNSSHLHLQCVSTSPELYTITAKGRSVSRLGDRAAFVGFRLHLPLGRASSWPY
jgi:hypothetical protein